MAKIAIVIPVYKVPEKYLRDCIESCLGQTVDDIEVIAVDDGSPDDNGRILDEYAASDPRLRVIHKENGGLVSARNAGYEAVTAPWHMYLDGDDFIDPDTCEHLLDAVERHPDVDVIFWRYVQELGERSIKGKGGWKCDDDEKVYAGADECHELARNTLVYTSNIATAYCKLINTDYARSNGLHHDPSLRQGSEGLEFSLRVFYHASKALFLNRWFNHYIYNPDSISKAVNERNTEYLRDCYVKMAEVIDAFPERDKFRKVLHDRVAYMLLAIAMNTYFHPSNPDSLLKKSRKYHRVVTDETLFRESIKECDARGMGWLRYVAMTVVRLRLYPLLGAIATIKVFMLKRGKYNY